MKLHLHVKSEYFAQIKAGTKKEEFRLASKWTRKLNLEHPKGCFRPYQFDGVVIYDAYKKATPETRLEFPWNSWTLKVITHPHFGPNPVPVFAIKLEAQA